MSGIIFAGCSYTHGHGLWLYDRKRYQKYYNGDDYSEKKYHHLNVKNIFRFPRLVSQEFEKFEITRRAYSGNDEDSLDFINQLFHLKRPNTNWTEETYQFEDVDYIILQTSYPHRSHFQFENGQEIRLTDSNVDILYNKLKQYGFSSYEEYTDKLLNQLFTRIKTTFQFYEERGIIPFIINITNDYDKLIESDYYMSNRWIKIKYDGITYNSMSEASKNNHELSICTDYEFFGNNPPQDKHPSKKFHKVIADNIIKKIKSFEKNNFGVPPLKYI